ncbi:hypothetical protein EAG_07343 [Camponotus floridanus]|uniref:Uncharacterized protein n=1 Tax=Camponotus floridanus TaxID=104421 RepID=E2AFF2_CAMFO|nr:hypothetical protein EAG_07343 [Camponotus floridanus]
MEEEILESHFAEAQCIAIYTMYNILRTTKATCNHFEKTEINIAITYDQEQSRLLSRFVKKVSELVQTHTAMPIFIETMFIEFLVSDESASNSTAHRTASFLPLPSQRGRGRNILDVPRGIEGGYLHTNDNWWVSVSRFGREVSPGPPTRRSETTTTTTRRPLAVTHRVLPSSGVPTYSGYQRTDRPNEASVDAAHPNGPDLSARKTHVQHLLTLSRATVSRLNNAFTVGGVTQSRRVSRVSFFVCSPKRFYSFIFNGRVLLLEDKLFTSISPISILQVQLHIFRSLGIHCRATIFLSPRIFLRDREQSLGKETPLRPRVPQDTSCLVLAGMRGAGRKGVVHSLGGLLRPQCGSDWPKTVTNLMISKKTPELLTPAARYTCCDSK